MSNEMPIDPSGVICFMSSSRQVKEKKPPKKKENDGKKGKKNDGKKGRKKMMETEKKKKCTVYNVMKNTARCIHKMRLAGTAHIIQDFRFTVIV